jgi:hypothetical protein
MGSLSHPETSPGAMRPHLSTRLMICAAVAPLAIALSYLNLVGMTRLHPANVKPPSIGAEYGYPCLFFWEVWPIANPADSNLYCFHDLMFTRERAFLPQLFERVLFLHRPSEFHGPALVWRALFDSAFTAVLLTGNVWAAAWFVRRCPYRCVLALLLLFYAALCAVCAALGISQWLGCPEWIILAPVLDVIIGLGCLYAFAWLAKLVVLAISRFSSHSQHRENSPTK